MHRGCGCRCKGRHPDFSPHLTLARATPAERDEQRAALAEGWAPLRFEVRSVQILVREADTPFRTAFTVDLGVAEEDALLGIRLQ